MHRREDPTHVAFPHRLKFSFSPDEGLELDADHLRSVCAGEWLSDWATSKALGGTSARSDYQRILSELSDTWSQVSGAIQRGEHIGAPSSKLLTDTVLNVFERRYARFAKVLPAGKAREEILANIARQLGELRVYFASFDASLADCASRLEYARQARWIGSRVHTLFAPAVALILAADGDGFDAAGGLPPESQESSHFGTARDLVMTRRAAATTHRRGRPARGGPNWRGDSDAGVTVP